MTFKQAEAPPKLLDIILKAAKKRWPGMAMEARLVYSREPYLVIPISMPEIKYWDCPKIFFRDPFWEREEIHLDFRLDIPDRGLTYWLGYGPRSKVLGVCCYDRWAEEFIVLG